VDQNTLQAVLREAMREAMREAVAEFLQMLLHLDREAFLQERGGCKNGYYSRKLETTFGQVEVAIPRDREGRYYPSFLQPYARRLVDVGGQPKAMFWWRWPFTRLGLVSARRPR